MRSNLKYQAELLVSAREAGHFMPGACRIKAAWDGCNV